MRAEIKKSQLVVIHKALWRDYNSHDAPCQTYCLHSVLRAPHSHFLQQTKTTFIPVKSHLTAAVSIHSLSCEALIWFWRVKLEAGTHQEWMFFFFLSFFPGRNLRLTLGFCHCTEVNSEFMEGAAEWGGPAGLLATSREVFQQRGETRGQDGILALDPERKFQARGSLWS